MKNILVAISGLTPQIVTETLFALTTQKNIVIDELFILTTQRGKLVLLGKDKSPKTPNVSFLSQLKELCSVNNVKLPNFNSNKNLIVANEETIELFDIKTDSENILFPNKTAELIKKLTANQNSIIHASISGGRKSMSAHLALVMSLFARKNDKLYHILTDEKFEFNNFYPKTKEEKEALIIAEIPFVKMRSLNAPILKESLSYSKLVEKAQLRLKLLSDEAKLVIDLRKREIRYKDKSVFFTPIELVIYLTFCEIKIESDKKIGVSELQSKEFAEKLLFKLTEYFNYYYDLKDSHHWSIKGISSEYFRSIRSKINSKLNSILTPEELFEFQITTERIYGDSSYKIVTPKEKIGINYD
ncbi:MAG: TIGR02584 family CRISPR-associated protein [Ignavibacteriales bacterium CG18_big_fil_WC_8_21_14_2_50_31_20]|nr:MAG: TIGR02584 family CRISPR-associated protein [Ignavibacteriales bacterium CG18_big_fil_WC_8_21_14_2_50_31_20]